MAHQLSLDSINNTFAKLIDPIPHEMEHFGIPGVSIGVLFDDQELTASFGVTSVENPLPVTPETLFQVGSITKTLTGTVVMRLVEMGKLNLDEPVRQYLPFLKLSDETVARKVNLRHLLTHTGGWAGDYFNDFGYGEDALAKMVDRLADLPQLTPLGEVWSYNNAGFYLVGRLIEVVTGMPYESVMKEMLLDPLAMQHSFFFPQDVISYRFAVGHEVIDGSPRVARPWAVGRALHPIGGLVTNLPDLFRYARFHMGDGTPIHGKRLLQAETLDQMHIPLVKASGIRSYGLSWAVTEINGQRLISHGGGTKGQVTFLGVSPIQHFAVAILTNGEQGDPVTSKVWSEALSLFLGLELPVPQPFSSPPEIILQYIGKYDGMGEQYELKLVDGGLLLTTKIKGGFPTPDSPPMPDPQPVRAALYADDCLVILDEPMKGKVGEFLRSQDGLVEWIRLGGRIYRAVR